VTSKNYTEAEMALTDQYVTVDGLRARYFEDGDGPPTLLLHGAALGSSADVWERSLPQLAREGRRVIAYDHPGFGFTDNPSDASAGYRRDFILKFMDALGLAQAAIVGHSASGGQAMDAALRNPERISALVILGTRSLLPPLPGETAPPGGAEEAPDHEPTIDDVREVLEEQLYHHELITPELLERRLRVAVGKNHQAGLARRQSGRPAGGQGTPIWQRIGEAQVPLLFIYGRDDGGDPAARVAIAKERHPTLEFHVLDQCKHLVQLDQEAEFVRLTSRFLPSQARAAV
jgi:2-hydroxy-6-oxonona-2,4-dienedioate hydrolase/4,5:9,10-diseco-3-hydroxy-5,9,17-trioxoandrosta-1(10),2-diene-4-oate hydrolase